MFIFSVFWGTERECEAENRIAANKIKKNKKLPLNATLQPKYDLPFTFSCGWQFCSNDIVRKKMFARDQMPMSVIFKRTLWRYDVNIDI